MATEDQVVSEVNRSQLQHFTEADSRCRAVQLPEGIMLRYNLSQSLYFYLHTGAHNGKITTQVYASDSPYDRRKCEIGEVHTPMFEAHADLAHLEKLKGLLNRWVEFVADEPGTDENFQSFTFKGRG